MRKIPLTQGKFAVVDDEDYEAVSRLKWHAHHNGGSWYALRAFRRGGRLIHQSMHVFLLNLPKLMRIDHKDCDGLNNRRSNLRIATQAENAHNSRLRKDNKTGYKGVSVDRAAWCREKPYLAQICFKRKNYFLGHHRTAEQAAVAYNEKAKEFHGEFARVNTIKDSKTGRACK